jgi:hypothetical protein
MALLRDPEGFRWDECFWQETRETINWNLMHKGARWARCAEADWGTIDAFRDIESDADHLMISAPNMITARFSPQWHKGHRRGSRWGPTLFYLAWSCPEGSILRAVRICELPHKKLFRPDEEADTFYSILPVDPFTASVAAIDLLLADLGEQPARNTPEGNGGRSGAAAAERPGSGKSGQPAAKCARSATSKTARSGTGGRPPKWDKLWALIQEMKDKTDKDIAAKYNRQQGAVIGKGGDRATAEIVKRVRYDRTCRQNRDK